MALNYLGVPTFTFVRVPTARTAFPYCKGLPINRTARWCLRIPKVGPWGNKVWAKEI